MHILSRNIYIYITENYTRYTTLSYSIVLVQMRSRYTFIHTLTIDVYHDDKELSPFIQSSYVIDRSSSDKMICY